MSRYEKVRMKNHINNLKDLIEISLNVGKIESPKRCPICKHLLHFYVAYFPSGNIIWYECHHCEFVTDQIKE